MRQETRTALTSFAVFGSQAVISLLLTRFLVRQLGVYEYAMVPLVNSFVPYLAVAASSIGTAVGRELTISRRSGEGSGGVDVFSTGIIVSVVVAVVVVVLAVGLGPVAVSLLGVPDGLRASATLLLAAAGVAAAAAVLRSPLLAVAFSENRLDADNLVIFSEVLARAAVTALLFLLLSPSLGWVAAGMVAGALVALLGAVGTWRRLVPSLRPSIGAFKGERVGVLLNTSGWFLLGQIGALLFWSTDLFVLSIMTTATTVGYYGTVAVWPVFLRGLASAGTSFLNPVLVRRFGDGDREGVLQASLTAVRLTGLAVALPVGVVAGFAAPLLAVWLGPDFVKLTPVLVALVLPLSLNLSVVPLFGVNVSYGKLAWPGIMTLVAGVINIGLSVAWSHTWPLGLGVALGTAVALTTKNALFTPWYAAKLQRAPLRSYFSAMVPGVLAALVVFGSSWGLSRIAFVSTLPGLVLAGFAVSGVFCVLVWTLVLSHSDKETLRQAVRRQPGAQPAV